MTDSSRRPGFRAVAFWAMVVSLVVGAALSFVGSLAWLDRPFPGFKVRIDRTVEIQLPPNSTGAKAGLVPGDRVLTVNGAPLTDSRTLYAFVAAMPIGTPVSYEFERALPNGDLVRLRKVIATQHHGLRQWASFFLALWLTGLSFFVLGATVSALRPDAPLARANLAFHAVGAAFCFSIFDQSTGYLSLFGDPYRLGVWFVALTYTNLALQFPRQYPGLEGIRRLNLVLGLAGAALLMACHAVPRLGFWSSFAPFGYVAVAEVALLANSLWTFLAPKSTAREKAQGKILLLGALLSTVPGLVVPLAHYAGAPVNLEGFENFVLPLWPLAISYAIVRHQLFDISPFVKRSLTYVLSAALLTLLYVLATTATEMLLGSRTRLPDIAATVLVAFAFAPVRDRVKRWLDARFFRSPYRFDEVVAAFTRTAQETADPALLMQAYREALDRALAPTRLALFLHKDGPLPVASLGCTEPELRELATALDRGGSSFTWRDEPMRVLPLVVQDHLLGHAVVGPKKSEQLYTELDRALLRELTQLLAVWLNLFERFEEAHLQTQEIEALKRSEALQSQFLNVVSHELKIPLSVIMSSLAILKRSEATHDARTLNHLGRIRRSLTHLVGLVSDLLDAGQLQSGHFRLRTRPLALEAIAQETLAEMRPLAEPKTHLLTLRVAPELPAVSGDEARLAQVFRNLLHNAIRYTPPNGRIHLALAPDGGGIRCEVSDTGLGIEPGVMTQLFQRFSQVHAEAPDRDQGVGLGLFISKAIVEAHGGGIGVESRPGEGSTFWFTLPALLERKSAEELPGASSAC